MTASLIATFGVVVALMIALWLVSLLIGDVSIVDIFWGPGFSVIAWTSHALARTDSWQSSLLPVMTTIWGARLAIHLAIRNLGHGEDRRYRAMRSRYGATFPIVSLATVFLLQAALMWVVSLPLQAGQFPGVAAPPLGTDIAGVALWATGFAMETIADLQLTQFKRAPENAGQVMNRGLWRYSRHPNYFGDFLVWWGFGVLAAGAGGWWALIGPVVMSVLLMKVSGVSLLESTITERRPDYRAYIEQTSAFVPWIPRARDVDRLHLLP